MRDHKKLKAFQLADNLTLAVYKVTKLFPKDEMFGLTSQLRRSALSVSSNIVEGSARESMSEYLHFLNIAYGSLKEAEHQLSIAMRLGDINQNTYEPIRTQFIETSKVLGSLIRSLKSKPL